MTVEWLPMAFTVCQVRSAQEADLSAPFVFFARTDKELSLVCPEDICPATAVEREDGWRCFRLPGTLDFSLVGILARITGCLADAGIPVFAASTFDTDYVLVRSPDAERAAAALEALG